MKNARAFLLIIALAAVVACSNGLPPEFPAADFTLKSPMTGRETSFAAVKGRPLMIYWFTSW